MTFFTLSSTNIDHSTPNLVKIYVIIRSLIIRSQMSLIMDLIGPELSELPALELENLPYLTIYTLASANIERWEIFVLEFRKIAESDFVYTLASTNINQSAPNLVKMYVAIRSPMRLIMDLLRPELSELCPLEFAKIAESDFVYTIPSRPISTKHGHSIYYDEF